VLVDDTKLTLLKSEPPAALTPKNPPTDPARTAISAIVPFPLFGCVVDCHHAAGAI
jgi:hypothetical protein